MSAHTPVQPTSAESGEGHPNVAHRPSRRLIPVLAGLVSAVYAVLAGIWTFEPSTNAFADADSYLAGDTSLLLSVLNPESAARVLFALSLCGVVVSVLTVVAHSRAIRTANGLVGGFGIVFALVVGLGMVSAVAISMTGYLMAVVVAVGAVILGIHLVRTSPVGRWMVALAVGALVAVFATDVLPVSALSDLGGMLAALASELAPVGLVWGLVVGSLLWALVAGLAVRDTTLSTRLGGWVLRHRRVITILAALGPLPYALIRLTWLTPWPQLTIDGALPIDMRIWGLLLSSGAWAGVVLTIGLIRPWGERFPRWMPFVAGRRVPIWAAAGPGAAIAAVLCVSAAPLIRMFAAHGLRDALASALIFPLWFWGPALALAVWGYVLHRRATEHVTAA